MAKTKKDKKLKKKQKQLEQFQRDPQKFDVIHLLKTESLETKPDVAAFLEKYIARITAVVNYGKVQFYPIVECTFSKVFIVFFDGHELMYSQNVLNGQPHYSMYDDQGNQMPLSSTEQHLVESFFAMLQQFNFMNCI